MKIYKVHFEAMYPIGCCLIIAAENYYEAEQIAEKTITHTTIENIEEVDISKPCVVEYLSGDY